MLNKNNIIFKIDKLRAHILFAFIAQHFKPLISIEILFVVYLRVRYNDGGRPINVFETPTHTHTKRDIYTYLQ